MIAENIASKIKVINRSLSISTPTTVLYLYFSNRKIKQIFIIKIGLIDFQNILVKMNSLQFSNNNGFFLKNVGQATYPLGVKSGLYGRRLINSLIWLVKQVDVLAHMPELG